jgi:hypothetical protein
MDVHKNKMGTHIFTKNKYVVQKGVWNFEGWVTEKQDEFREVGGEGIIKCSWRLLHLLLLWVFSEHALANLVI